ncbi:MAG: hypothetical protein LBU07_04925 [Coriobacteriales bacterium]|jgi:hypothetical protein|nr:hypothetical protein [Coriobacteriales bacterium]
MSQLVEYAKELVDGVGPRPASSKGEHQAAERIIQNLNALGLSASLQEFGSARNSGWIRILYYLLGVGAAWVLFAVPDMKVLAFILALLSVGLLVLDLLDKNPFTRLINRGLSQNVVARYVPEGADPRRKIVVVAYYDSSRALIQCAPPLVGSYELLRRVVRFSLLALLVITLLFLLPLPEIVILIVGIIGSILGILVLLAALAEIVNQFLPYSQGANCNASGMAALLGVAQSLLGQRSGVFRARAKADKSSKAQSSEAAAGLRGSATGTRHATATGPVSDASRLRAASTHGSRGAAGADSARRTAGAQEHDAQGEAVDGALVGDVPRPGGLGATASLLLSKVRNLLGRRTVDDSGDLAGEGAPSSAEDTQSGRQSRLSGLRKRERAAVATTDPASPAQPDAQVTTGIQRGAQQATTRGVVDGTVVTSALPAVLAERMGSQTAPVIRPGGARFSENPNVRLRPPLSELQKQEVEEQAVAFTEHGRSASAVPDWFVKAKERAAQKTAAAAGAESAQDAASRLRLRSQFADLPAEAEEAASPVATHGQGADPAHASLVDAGTATRTAGTTAVGKSTGLAPDAAGNLAQRAAGNVAVPAVTVASALQAAASAKTVAAASSTATRAAATDAATRTAATGTAGSQPALAPDTVASVTPASHVATPGTVTPASNAVIPDTSREPVTDYATGDYAIDTSNSAEAVFATPPTSSVSPSAQTARRVTPSGSLQADFSGLDKPGALTSSLDRPGAFANSLAVSANDGADEHKAPASTAKALVSAPRSAAPAREVDDTPAATPLGGRAASGTETACGANDASAAEQQPVNQRLRNLPTISLGDSGSIPTQQATLYAPNQPQPLPDSDSRVSNTGSFAPLGATGVMKPVGEELFEYHEAEHDIYVEDVEDSGHSAQGGDSLDRDAGSQMVQMPKSRARSFFGNLGDRLAGTNRKEKLGNSPASWLGVNKDFNARSEGSQIGSWDHFSEDEDEGWQGGAYGGASDEDNQQALQLFSDELIDKEVWLVALGSHENKNAGIKALLNEYRRELRSALIINLDGVGAGDLCYTLAEGAFRPRTTDRRLQHLTAAASDALDAALEPVVFMGYDTDATAALKWGARAITIMGLDRLLPTGWRWLDDHLDVLDEDSIQLASDVVIQIIKSS